MIMGKWAPLVDRTRPFPHDHEEKAAAGVAAGSCRLPLGRLGDA
jgi:hypothetical protein